MAPKLGRLPLNDERPALEAGEPGTAAAGVPPITSNSAGSRKTRNASAMRLRWASLCACSQTRCGASHPGRWVQGKRRTPRAQPRAPLLRRCSRLSRRRAVAWACARREPGRRCAAAHDGGCQTQTLALAGWLVGRDALACWLASLHPALLVLTFLAESCRTNLSAAWSSSERRRARE